MKKFRLRNFTISSIVLAGLLFSGCDKFDDDDNDNIPAAGLMVFNLAPDKTIGVAISGNTLTNSPLAFTNYTGGYLGIYPGNRSVDAYDYTTGDSIVSAANDFQVEKYYSAFVVGANGTYQNVIVHDNFDSLSASSGQAYIRYINAIAGSTSPAVTISANGNNVVNENAAFASVSDFTVVAPGDVTITVNEGSTINATRTITLEQKKVYTVLLVSGATSAEPAQIKYVENGTLEDEGARRISSLAKSVNIK